MKNKKVKLPRSAKRHPLVIGIEGYMAKHKCSLRHIALKHLGVQQQTLFDWVEAARAKRDFQLPPRRVPDVCRLTGQEPHLYNPELWRAGWKFDAAK